MEDLKNLDDLLAPKLGLNKKITNVEIVKLPSKGAGSVMLNLKVTIRDENNKEELIHLVAKKIPASEFVKKLFNIQASFKKEVAFYETIVPVLTNFQKEEGVADVLDNFAEFYGARYNLHGKSDEVDENAVMLLEDLSVKGFVNFSKEMGFDFNATEKVLCDIAKFHGTVIAFKQKKPDIFEQKIKPHCTPFQFAKGGPIPEILLNMKKLIQTFPECAHFADKVTIFLERDTPTTCREPFGSLSHFDLWVNNILNKIENGEIVKNIFIDFQIYGFRSIAADIFFFLWTSVQKRVLEQNLDHFLVHYHSHLLTTLKKFNMDISNFEYKNFEEELSLEADFEFGHTLMFIFMLTFLKEFKVDAKQEFKVDLNDLNPDFKERVRFMVMECIRKGWLKQRISENGI